MPLAQTVALDQLALLACLDVPEIREIPDLPERRGHRVAPDQLEPLVNRVVEEE